MKINLLYPVNPILKKIINSYWIINNTTDSTIKGKLIPTNNIDFILNFGDPIKYLIDNESYIIKGCHFCGIQDKPRIIEHRGVIDIIGISFKPQGLYPIIKTPICEFSNKTVTHNNLIDSFQNLINKINSNQIEERLLCIENELLKKLDKYLIADDFIEKVINDFMSKGEQIFIKTYCEENNINQKKLERVFYKYIGTSPKKFLVRSKLLKIIKSNRLDNTISMSKICYDFNFFDQTHFIKSYKSLVGTTPIRQMQKRDIILDILMSYNK